MSGAQSAEPSIRGFSSLVNVWNLPICVPIPQEIRLRDRMLFLAEQHDTAGLTLSDNTQQCKKI